MNKKEAAERLNVTTRQVEHYVSKGRLTVTYVRGRTGKQSDYDESEVERLKTELETPDAPITALQAANSPTAGLVAPQERERFLALVEALTSAGKTQTLTLETRLFLTLKEAAQVAGLPRAMIKRAIDNGELKAVKTGSGWRVKSEDLSEYARLL
jgi:excisionase family DNA binding protein